MSSLLVTPEIKGAIHCPGIRRATHNAGMRGWNSQCCPAPLQQVRKPSCSRQSWQLTNPGGSAGWACLPQCLCSAKTQVGNCSELLRRVCSINHMCTPHISAVTLQPKKAFWRQRLDNLMFWLLNSILLFLINLPRLTSKITQQK